jgi:hypothetical protein
MKTERNGELDSWTDKPIEKGKKYTKTEISKNENRYRQG